MEQLHRLRELVHGSMEQLHEGLEKLQNAFEKIHELLEGLQHGMEKIRDQLDMITSMEYSLAYRLINSWAVVIPCISPFTGLVWAAVKIK